MLEQVLESLAACKGKWREIARYMDPLAPDSYYSWLTKLAQGTIKDPSVNKIQRLFDYFISTATPDIQGGRADCRKRGAA